MEGENTERKEVPGSIGQRHKVSNQEINSLFFSLCMCSRLELNYIHYIMSKKFQKFRNELVPLAMSLCGFHLLPLYVQVHSRIKQKLT